MPADRELLQGEIISQASDAFMLLMVHSQILLRGAEVYISMNPKVFGPTYKKTSIKLDGLKSVALTITNSARQITGVIRRWQFKEQRLLDKRGVEINLLNELWIAMNLLKQFLIDENICIDEYDQKQAELAFDILRMANRKLP